MDGTTVRGARIVMGAVAPIPWRSQAAERALVGKADHRTVGDGGRGRGRPGAKPMTQNAYKVTDRADRGEARRHEGRGLEGELGMNRPDTPVTSPLALQRTCGTRGCTARRTRTRTRRWRYRDPIEATAFWCACTQKAFGPDGLPANAELCGEGRGCCEH